MQKALLLCSLCLILAFTSQAQAPNAFNYQGVARNTAGAPLANTSIGLKLTVHDGSATGTTVYQETFNVTTNAFGLYNVSVGAGTIVSGTFSGIVWGSGAKYMEVAVDPAGGTSYTSLGASQLLSVPYALYAANAPAGSGGDNWGTQTVVTDGTLVGNGTTTSPLQIAPHGATAGQVLQWNGTTWLPATALSGAGWLLTGNTTTNPATNFIGTTDTSTLRFKVNGTWAGELDYNKSNVAFGTNAGHLTTGRDNIAIGRQALSSDVADSQQIAIGGNALAANTTGSENTAVGFTSLQQNTTGSENAAFGNKTLVNNTTGLQNVAIGDSTMMMNTTGMLNTAVGVTSLSFNTTGSENTAVGNTALFANTTGAYNTAVGETALASGTNDSFNVAIGLQTMYSNTSGSANTIVGAEAGYENTSGSFNTAMGLEALASGTTDSFNTVMGYQAAASTTTGFSNTAIGSQAFAQNTTGSINTAIGVLAAFGNQTGNYNTAVGVQALYNNVTGSLNTAVGEAAGVGVDGLSNTTAIGNGATVNSSNRIVLGNASVTSIGGYVSFSNLSDGRFKTNIQANVPGLDFITRLKPVTYNFQARKFEKFAGVADSNVQKQSAAYDAAEAMVHTGFVAQDVEIAAAAANYNFSGIHKPQNDKDNYSLSYSEFTVPLVKAAQELNDKSNAQQAQIADLQKQLADLTLRLQQLEQKSK